MILDLEFSEAGEVQQLSPEDGSSHQAAIAVQKVLDIQNIFQ